MTDCPNAEVRDLLPDLLHERLDASARAMVLAHVAGCEDCRAELELLRGVRGALVGATPRVDTSAIVAALPKPPSRASVGVTPLRSRRLWTDWRVAAAAAFLVVAGSSLALLNREKPLPLQPVDTTQVAVIPPSATTNTTVVSPAVPSPGAQSPSTSPTTPPSVVVPPAAPNRVVAATETDVPAIGATNRISDLSQKQLKALINDIEQMQAIPLADPEPVSIKVDSRSGPVLPDGGGVR